MRAWRLVLAAILLTACAAPGPQHLPRGPEETAARQWREAGEAALARGDLLRAERDLEQAVRLAPGDAAVWRALARLRQAQGREAEARRLRLRACRLAGRASCP